MFDDRFERLVIHIGAVQNQIEAGAGGITGARRASAMADHRRFEFMRRVDDSA
jgi:hypothetical protein